MKVTVKEEARVVYQMTTHQGVAEIDGEEVTYRYSEDDNGSDFFVLTEEGWNDTSGLEGDKYVALYAAIMEAGGNPEWLEEIEVGKELLEEYRN